MIPVKCKTNDYNLDAKAIEAYCCICKSNHLKSSCWQCTFKQMQMVSYITTFQIDGITDPTDAVFAVLGHADKKAKNRWLKKGAVDVL